MWITILNGTVLHMVRVYIFIQFLCLLCPEWFMVKSCSSREKHSSLITFAIVFKLHWDCLHFHDISYFCDSRDAGSYIRREQTFSWNLCEPLSTILWYNFIAIDFYDLSEFAKVASWLIVFFEFRMPFRSAPWTSIFHGNFLQFGRVGIVVNFFVILSKMRRD